MDIGVGFHNPLLTYKRNPGCLMAWEHPSGIKKRWVRQAPTKWKTDQTHQNVHRAKRFCLCEGSRPLVDRALKNPQKTKKSPILKLPPPFLHLEAPKPQKTIKCGPRRAHTNKTYTETYGGRVCKVSQPSVKRAPRNPPKNEKETHTEFHSHTYRSPNHKKNTVTACPMDKGKKSKK